VTRGSGSDADVPRASSELARVAGRPAADPLHVTVLSSDARPTAGWGMFTTQVCRALSARGDVRVNLLLPHGVPSALDGDFATTQNVLPPADRSFRRHPWNLGRHVLRPPSVPTVDIVHALVEFPYALDAAAIARRRAVPYMVSAQGTYAVVPLQRPPDRWFYGYALRRAAVVTVPSTYTRDALLHALGKPARVELLANGVDPTRFANGGDTRSTRARFGLPPTGTVVLSIGALKRRKGFDVLLRAFATVRDVRPDTYLVIVGSGDQTGLRSLAGELGLSDNVRLTGELSESDVVDLYHACSLFALLPRCESGHFEGFGLVFLEAGACAKPVVGTRSGGVPDAVVHGETGFLVEEEDATAAAYRMLQVLDDPRLARALGERGRRWAQQHSWVQYADRLVSMYRAMLLSRSQSG
jgi:phosphatidyl-myo-inositol dimannoside synthase